MAKIPSVDLTLDQASDELIRLKQQLRDLQEERLDLLALLEQTQRTVKQGFELSLKIFDSMPGLLLVIDSSGSCSMTNPALNQLLGSPVVVGRPAAELFLNPEELERCVASLQKHKALRDYILTLKPLDPKLPAFDVIFNINQLQDWLNEEQLGEFGANQVLGFVFTGQLASEVRSSNVLTVEANRRLALLNLISDRIRSSLDLSKVLESVVTELSKLLGLDRCLLIELENDVNLQGGFVTQQYIKPGIEPLKSRVITDLGYPAFKAAISTGQPVIVDDTINTYGPDENDHYPEMMPPSRSLLVLPVVFSNQRIALLTLAFVNSQHNWTPGEIELAVEVAERAAGAITNARLFAEVMAERQHNSAILNSMGEGVVTLDSEGRVRLINPVAERLLDIQADLVIGELAFDVLPFLPNEQAVGKTEQRFEYNEQIIGVATTPLLDEGGESVGTVSVLRDVTEAARLERLKDEFITLASHEMRTPLTAITAALDLLTEEDLGPLSSLQQEFLQVARSNNLRLNSMLNSILDISSIESGRASLDLGPVLLQEVVTSAVSGPLKEALKSKDLTLRVNLTGAVKADASRMVQIVENLLSNACKFTPNGGLIEVYSESCNNDQVRVTVTDSGIGMSEEERRRLFEKFYRVDNSLTRETSGSGLGLSVTKSLIELHGGRLEVASIPGNGSCFSFTLPRYI